MADVSSSDLGSAQNPLPGLDASDYAGYGSGGNLSSPASSIGGLGGAAALGVGALGFGAILAQGEGSLPGEFNAATGNATWENSTGQSLIGAGEGMVGQGQQALLMAQNGQLTPEQQATLSQYRSGLTNQSRQQFYNMGVNPDSNTAFVTQQGNIDTQVNAMAQQEIQSTIALGLGEVQGGNSLISSGTGEVNAANQTLIAAGQAQIQLDQQYSSSLTSAFGSIATLFGAAVKAAPMVAAL